MLIPVVLSGGAGTRLWPVSREGHPKPFMRMADGESLLEKTYKRALECPQLEMVLTVTNRDYYFQSKDCWHGIKNRSVSEQKYLLEPEGRNTAPALLMAALQLQAEYGNDALMLVLAADHLITDTAAFSADVDRAAQLAHDGYLVTFGIVPDSPETGFGYIKAGGNITGMDGFVVDGFVEKPDKDTAQVFIDQGDYYWNSGMFCFSIGTLLDEFREHQSDMLKEADQCWEVSACKQTDAYCELDDNSFTALQDVSIDYAVMEHSKRRAVVPAGFDWSDIGSWNAMAELQEPDDSGNQIVGDGALVIDSKDCFIQAGERIVATVGVENLLIVDTLDAVLVGNRNKAQQVREVVKHLKQRGNESYKFHRTVSRPWGTYTVLEEGHRYKIKRIEVKVGERLSLQMHHHRSEHWIVVKGTARVVNGDKEFLVRANESTYIPAGHQHRLENPGVVDLVMIEVQSGEYLEEDDIVRFEDTYGRT